METLVTPEPAAVFLKLTKPSVSAPAAIPVSLSECHCGERVAVVRFSGKPELGSRLEAVGIHPGQELTIFHATRRGGMVLDSQDMRLALDRRLADQIVVQRLCA